MPEWDNNAKMKYIYFNYSTGGLVSIMHSRTQKALDGVICQQRSPSRLWAHRWEADGLRHSGLSLSRGWVTVLVRLSVLCTLLFTPSSRGESCERLPGLCFLSPE